MTQRPQTTRALSHPGTFITLCSMLCFAACGSSPSTPPPPDEQAITENLVAAYTIDGLGANDGSGNTCVPGLLLPPTPASRPAQLTFTTTGSSVSGTLRLQAPARSCALTGTYQSSILELRGSGCSPQCERVSCDSREFDLCETSLLLGARYDATTTHIFITRNVTVERVSTGTTIGQIDIDGELELNR